MPARDRENSVLEVHTFQHNASASASANGDGEIRTLDPLLARQVLSQLSYAPLVKVLLFSIVFSFRMGLNGLEPSTSRLSGVRSNQLSYKPIFFGAYT